MNRTRSLQCCSVGSGISLPLLSRAAFPKSSLRVLGWPVRNQASKVLSLTSLLPLSSQFDGLALPKNNCVLHAVGLTQRQLSRIQLCCLAQGVSLRREPLLQRKVMHTCFVSINMDKDCELKSAFLICVLHLHNLHRHCNDFNPEGLPRRIPLWCIIRIKNK